MITFTTVDFLVRGVRTILCTCSRCPQWMLEAAWTWCDACSQAVILSLLGLYSTMLNGLSGGLH